MQIRILFGGLIAVLVLLGGCRGGSSSRAAASQNPAPAASTQPGADLGQPHPTSPEGSYVINSVMEKDVEVEVSPSNAISLSFFPNGSYTRSSKGPGAKTHFDTGNFRVEPPDHLVLTKVMDDKKPVIEKNEKTYRFTLSGDGSELRLWGDSGNIAVFRRQSEAPQDATR